MDPDRLHEVDRTLHVIAVRQCSQQHEHPVCRGRSLVVVRWDLPVETGSAEDVLPALATVWPGQPHVHNPPLVQVVGRAHQRAGREFDHHRSFGEVQGRSRIGRVGVRREHHLLGSAFEQGEDLVRHHTAVEVALPGGHDRHGRVEESVALDRPVEIGVVVCPLDRLRCRVAANKGVAIRVVGHDRLLRFVHGPSIPPFAAAWAKVERERWAAPQAGSRDSGHSGSPVPAYRPKRPNEGSERTPLSSLAWIHR